MTNYTICQCVDYGHVDSKLLGCKWCAVHVLNAKAIRFITMPGESPEFHAALATAMLFMPDVEEIDVYDGKYIQRHWKKESGDWVRLNAGHDLYDHGRLDK